MDQHEAVTRPAAFFDLGVLHLQGLVKVREMSDRCDMLCEICVRHVV
jgi:hypothetical protein